MFLTLLFGVFLALRVSRGGNVHNVHRDSVGCCELLTQEPCWSLPWMVCHEPCDRALLPVLSLTSTSQLGPKTTSNLEKLITVSIAKPNLISLLLTDPPLEVSFLCLILLPATAFYGLLAGLMTIACFNFLWMLVCCC